MLHLDHAPADQELVALETRNPEFRFGRNVVDGGVMIWLKSRVAAVEMKSIDSYGFGTIRLPERGHVFQPWTAFSLADGSLVVAPIVAWLRPAANHRHEDDNSQLPLSLCPDLVVGVVPNSYDTLAGLHSVLEAFTRNGASVTALLEPFDRVTSVREKLQKPADRVADLARIEPSTVGLGSVRAHW